MNFNSFGLHEALLRAIEDIGWEDPTPIQGDAIPAGLEGRDVLACAMTGSGKTAAFFLPVLHHLLENPRRGTRVLVLVPTRELAAQVRDHFLELAAHTDLRASLVMGGTPMKPQERAFRQGTEVIVATPGRLLDHFRYDYSRLDDLEVLVLDEADRMLDMGFLPDVREILDQLPEGLQTWFLSATLPPPIVSLSHAILSDPVRINIERKAAPASGITHAIYRVREELKRNLLLEMVRRDEIDNALIFTRTKARADRLADFLDRNGVRCQRIHGDLTQAQRTKALGDFKKGNHRLLVATDIAARGIDVVDLTHVINFDVPQTPEDYIHRVGRTARAESTGDAITLVSGQELAGLHAIEDALGHRLPRLTLDGFDYDGTPTDAGLVCLADRVALAQERRGKGKKETGSRGRRRRRGPASASSGGALAKAARRSRRRPADRDRRS